ncbi:hypothetical protein QQZ08_004877 [Neonectria magnoliae]|uniref:Uncharacterized protein n=1 Tax=Neonectria magnoliae TaxID=2732573 RepID=A0ABR1I5K6_9HYPO
MTSSNKAFLEGSLDSSNSGILSQENDDWSKTFDLDANFDPDVFAAIPDDFFGDAGLNLDGTDTATQNASLATADQAPGTSNLPAGSPESGDLEALLREPVAVESEFAQPAPFQQPAPSHQPAPFPQPAPSHQPAPSYQPTPSCAQVPPYYPPVPPYQQGGFYQQGFSHLQAPPYPQAPPYEPTSAYPDPNLVFQPRPPYGRKFMAPYGGEFLQQQAPYGGEILQRQAPSMNTLNSAAPQFAPYPGHGTGNPQYVPPMTNAFQPSLPVSGPPNLQMPVSRPPNAMQVAASRNSSRRPSSEDSSSTSHQNDRVEEVSFDRKLKKKNDRRCLPSSVYIKKPPVVPSWGYVNKMPLFSYTAECQWNHGLLFSREELAYYTQNCPRELTIWLQHYPAQCNQRLDESDKTCRWKDCPATENTMKAGWFRVVFDEFAKLTKSGKKDPFKVAGAMHLWCFEQCFDPLPHLEKGLVLPDERNFSKETKNPAKLTRDTDTYIIDRALNRWKERQKENPSTKFPRPHEESLSFALVNYHLKHESVTRQRQRARRNEGRPEEERNTSDYHKGDLSFYVRREKLRKDKVARKDKAGKNKVGKNKAGKDNCNKQGQQKNVSPAQHEAFARANIDDAANLQPVADCIQVSPLADNSTLPAPDVNNPGMNFNISNPAPNCNAGGGLPTAPQSIGNSRENITVADGPAPRERARSLISNEDLYSASPKSQYAPKGQEAASKNRKRSDGNGELSSLASAQFSASLSPKLPQTPKTASKKRTRSRTSSELGGSSSPKRQCVREEAGEVQQSGPAAPTQGDNSSELGSLDNAQLCASVSPKLRQTQDAAPKKRTRSQASSVDSLFGEEPGEEHGAERRRSHGEKGDGERQAEGVTGRRRSARSLSKEA